MKEQEEINYINRHKRQARQFDPSAVVVPAKRARAAIDRAFIKGYREGLESSGRKYLSE